MAFSSSNLYYQSWKYHNFRTKLLYPPRQIKSLQAQSFSLFLLGSRGGACAVVRALAPHQCGPDSNSGVDAICGLSLLFIIFLAPRGISPGTPVFPSPQKPTLPIPNRYGTHGHVSTSSQELLSAPWVDSRGTQRRFPPKYIENTF